MSPTSLTERVDTIEVDGDGVPFQRGEDLPTASIPQTIGLEVALEALREARRERKVTIDDLWQYGTLNRVVNDMRPYLESLS